MAKILTLSEMLDCICAIDVDAARGFQLTLEGVANGMGEFIANRLAVASKPASTEGFDMGGTAVAFYATTADQACPSPLDRFDEGGDWEVSAGNHFAPPSRAYIERMTG